MHFELRSVCTHTPTYSVIAWSITIIYSLWCLVSRFRRGDPVVLASIPVFLHVPLTWLGLARIAEVRSRGFAGAAVAAGLAEVLGGLLLASAVSAVLALVAAFVAKRGSLAAAALVIAGITGAATATLWFAARLDRHADMRAAQTGAVIAALAGIVLLVVAARFRTVAGRAHIAALLALAISCGAVAFIVSRQIAVYQSIAVGHSP